MSSIDAKSYEAIADPVVAYCAEHTAIQTPIQVELQNETLTNVEFGGMLGAPEVLTFGQHFIHLIGGKRVLDVGTFTGASALAWALAIPQDGEVYTLDIDLENYNRFGVPIISKDQKSFKKITAIEGPGLESLDKLIAGGQAGSFDFAFIDAEKTSYPEYYEKCLTLLRSGGVIFVDNSLRDGRVVDPTLREDPSNAAIHATNDIIFKDPRNRSALLNLGDGTHIAFKK